MCCFVRDADRLVGTTTQRVEPHEALQRAYRVVRPFARRAPGIAGAPPIRLPGSAYPGSSARIRRSPGRTRCRRIADAAGRIPSGKGRNITSR